LAAADTVQFSLRRSAALLAHYVRPLRAQVAVLTLLLAGSTALQLANPQVLRAFVDAATGASGNGSAGFLRGTALLFIVFALCQQALAVVATYLSERIGWAATNALREDLMLHCLRLDLSFHKARTPGELIERIDGDVTALANFFSQLVIQIAGNVVLLAGIVVMLWRVDWRAGAALGLYAVLASALLIKLRGITIPYWRRARQASADLFGYLEERLGGTEDLRASGAEAYAIWRLYQPLRERIVTNCKARVIGVLQWGPAGVLAAAEISAAFILIFLLYRSGTITMGTAVMINAYTWLSFRPLDQITRQLEDMQKAGAGIIRIGDLAQEQSALHDPAEPVAIPPGPVAVDFDHVTFTYPEVTVDAAAATVRVSTDATEFGRESQDEVVLNDVSFRLEPGRVLGLLGRTGSGKTTISRLLFRLYDPTSGAVRLNGVDLRDAARADVRRRVGMVTQDVQLFRASVRDNVALFDESIPDAQIVAALDDLGLGRWLAALPDGLDTLLGSDGAGVSAGEAQLLAFTRVFLKDPGLVILDEASSRLDPATERLIERAVDRLLRPVQSSVPPLGAMPGQEPWFNVQRGASTSGHGGIGDRLAGPRTGIVIAHRLGTVQRCDEIMILERGQIVEHGSRTALAADRGSRFAALLRAGHEHEREDALGGEDDLDLQPAEVLQ
jgi:ABC-type multidrug transport system fused ATPase/permease subunit